MFVHAFEALFEFSLDAIIFNDSKTIYASGNIKLMHGTDIMTLEGLTERLRDN